VFGALKLRRLLLLNCVDEYRLVMASGLLAAAGYTAGHTTL